MMGEKRRGWKVTGYLAPTGDWLGVKGAVLSSLSVSL